jgi:hypothetical protein
MNGVIGEILPLALGVAISPVPIIAAILMLLSPKAKGTSVGFLGGWVLGIVVAVVPFTLLASVLPEAGRQHLDAGGRHAEDHPRAPAGVAGRQAVSLATERQSASP